MKCRICGAKLRKDGDICKSCYEEYCKEEALEKDTQEIFKIYRKHLPKYQLTQWFDWILITIFVIIALLAQEQYLGSFLFIIGAFLVFGFAMFIVKKRAINTTCTFYEKKVVFKYRDNKKILAYSDLKNVTYYQNFFQKIFKLGDIQFHPDSGSYLFGGFEIKNVPDIEENWEKIQEILEIKREV